MRTRSPIFGTYSFGSLAVVILLVLSSGKSPVPWRSHVRSPPNHPPPRSTPPCPAPGAPASPPTQDGCRGLGRRRRTWRGGLRRMPCGSPRGARSARTDSARRSRQSPAASPRKDRLLALDVGCYRLGIIERERERIEYLGRRQAGEALEYPLHRGAIAKEREEPADRKTRPRYIGAPTQ